MGSPRRSSALRVLMVTWEYPPWYTGGAGTACRGMVQASLAEDLKVSVFLPWSGRALEPDRSGNLSGLEGAAGFPGYGGFGSYGRGTPFDSIDGITAGFDIIHCHDWLTIPAALKLRQRFRRPLVLHIHSLESDRSPEGGDPGIAGIEADGCRRADLVLAVSGYTAAKITGEYGIDPGKVKVLHNGYDPVESPGSGVEGIQGLRTVLFLGRLAAQKGPDIFLDTAIRIIGARNDVRFLIAGTGPLESHLKQRARAARDSDRVVFTGFVPRDRVPGLLEGADVLVIPSRSEPFGIVGLEAMSRGTAVVVTKDAGLTEVVKNVLPLEHPGVPDLLPLLNDVLDAPGFLDSLGRAGKEEAARLTWRYRVQELKEMYSLLSP